VHPASPKDATFPTRVKQAARLVLLTALVGASLLPGCRAPEKDDRRTVRVPPVEEADVATRAASPSRPAGGRPPVLWIGLDGLDWEILDRLAAAGKMPNWQRLVSEGWSARLESFFPRSIAATPGGRGFSVVAISSRYSAFFGVISSESGSGL